MQESDFRDANVLDRNPFRARRFAQVVLKERLTPPLFFDQEGNVGLAFGAGLRLEAGRLVAGTETEEAPVERSDAVLVASAQTDRPLISSVAAALFYQQASARIPLTYLDAGPEEWASLNAAGDALLLPSGLYSVTALMNFAEQVPLGAGDVAVSWAITDDTDGASTLLHFDSTPTDISVGSFSGANGSANKVLTITLPEGGALVLRARKQLASHNVVAVGCTLAAQRLGDAA